MTRLSEIISEALKTVEERGKIYGDSYKRHGEVMSKLFPNGISLDGVDDFNRFGVLNMQVSKLIRYTQSWDKRHIDSSHDLAVYSFMQEELDREYHDINFAEGVAAGKQFK